MLRVNIYLLLSLVIFGTVNSTEYASKTSSSTSLTSDASGSTSLTSKTSGSTSLTSDAASSDSMQDISKLECQPDLSYDKEVSADTWVEPRIFSQHVLGCAGNILGWEISLSQAVTELYADIWRPSEDGTMLELISSELLQGVAGDNFLRASKAVSLQPRDLIGVHGPGVEFLHKGQEDIGETSSRIVTTTDFTVGSVINADTDTTLDADFAKVAKIRPLIEETTAINFYPKSPNHANGKFTLGKNNMDSSMLYTINSPLPFSKLWVAFQGTNLACKRSRDSISRGQGSVMVVAGQQPIGRSLRRGPFGAGHLSQCVMGLDNQIDANQTRCGYNCQCSESTGCDVVHMLMIPDFLGDTPTIIDTTQTRIKYTN